MFHPFPREGGSRRGIELPTCALPRRGQGMFTYVPRLIRPMAVRSWRGEGDWFSALPTSRVATERFSAG